MTPARRWSPFTVVARACVVGLLIAGCGSSASHSTSADGTSASSSPTTAPQATPSSPVSESSSSVTAPDGSRPTEGIDPPVVDSTLVDGTVVDVTVWQPQDLGEFAADSLLSIVNTGDTTTLIYPEGGNTFRSMMSVDDGPFVSRTITVAGATYLNGLRAAATPSGMVAIFSDTGTLLPRVLTSTDGIEWSEAEVTGLDQPADIWLLSSTADGVYAAGELRTGAHPNDGPFAPGMWYSTDGVSWDSIVLPAGLGGDGGAVTALAQGTDGIVAAINSTIVRSTDKGASWSASAFTLPSDVHLRAITDIDGDVGGDTLVAIAATDTGADNSRLVTLRSFDDGQTWEATALAESGIGYVDPERATLAVAAGAYWISTARRYDYFNDPDVCYSDLSLCARGGAADLLRSDDGVAWSEVDLRDLSSTGYFNVLDVVDRGEGLLVVTAERNLTGWSWPSDVTPPLNDPAPAPTAPREPLAAVDGPLTVGTVYRFPLYLHCGMQYLGNFNGKYWTVDPLSAPVNPKVGAGEDAPPQWPIVQEILFGYITLVEPGTIEYSLPSGEVIAKFHPVDSQPAFCK